MTVHQFWTGCDSRKRVLHPVRQMVILKHCARRGYEEGSLNQHGRSQAIETTTIASVQLLVPASTNTAVLRPLKPDHSNFPNNKWVASTNTAVLRPLKHKSNDAGSVVSCLNQHGRSQAIETKIVVTATTMSSEPQPTRPFSGH